MSDRVRIEIPVLSVPDNSNFTVDVMFEDRDSETPMAPGTVHWRVDCVTTDAEVQDWTAVTAGESVSIAIASAISAILDSANAFEIKELTVAGDKDAAYECSAQVRWIVRNRNIH